MTISPDTPSGAYPTVIAEFPAGAARGKTEDGLNVFRGLPYALPPVGQRRWKPPAALPDWHGLRDATRFGAACPQPNRRVGSVYECDIPDKDEDCLFLNIWAPQIKQGKQAAPDQLEDGAQPADAPAKGLPVFVWIHGGNLLRGAGSEPLTDGAALAKRGQVVVTINYRLGVLGFLAHPELNAESPDSVSGNYGVLDQIAALEWVQRNIAAVGGDPDNVTVAGESAGALSVYYLMCAPAARGLFTRAITQSGHLCSAQHLDEDHHGMGTGTGTGLAVASQLGGHDGPLSIADLRNWDAQTLAVQAIEAGFAAQGVVDGHVLPDQPMTMFETGKSAQVPLITGFNSGEILTLEFLMPADLPRDAATYDGAIRARYGDLADQFLALYPSDDIQDSTERAVGDALFGWTVLSAAKAQVKNGQPAYVYYFDHGYPESEARGLRGFHACELAYLFDTMKQSPPNWPKAPNSAEEIGLTRAIGDYWTGFAKDGVPRSENGPAWPPYSDGNAVLYFGDDMRIERNLLPGVYALMDADFSARRATGTVTWNWNVGVAAPLKT